MSEQRIIDTNKLLRLAEAAALEYKKLMVHANKKVIREFQSAANPAAIIALCKRVKELEALCQHYERGGYKE